MVLVLPFYFQYGWVIVRCGVLLFEPHHAAPDVAFNELLSLQLDQSNLSC